mmetsp:Transcript_1595/g.5833  ORF Transcript_1595/g.5833 Transcript_1595/m.5833 type:complete len:427 (+) Transcript_1595:46-1326(+)|eukprot:CAMPEP_0170133120 /NCGR_PEP_ID=MMETSP0033_2-20121228/1079_1 /TAXON_ID=195969 /ORGANISM="Dolichomastix tenuilepis, Strain CCMP3274" /LENGTH=426 /DNA_ID=CAMNT_0010368577 /DNA_START=13 /DNA_END=1293 /DNA_ORIENTATION=+
MLAARGLVQRPRVRGSRWAAAGSPRADLAWVTSAANRPHPDKVDKGGEDSWFVIVDDSGGAFGVADGVGGYGDVGVDPGLYSKVLMKNALASDALAEGPGNPRAVVAQAQEATKLPGASTVCVLQLDGKSGTLHACNVGDSGFRLIRSGDIEYATLPLQHYADCPYQLSCPDFEEEPDTAEDGALIELELQPGDVLVAASDGLFDNMFDEEILSITREAQAGASGSHSLAETLASNLASVAREHALDEEFPSPYAAEVSKRTAVAPPEMPAFAKGVFGKLAEMATPAVVGGKLDDITVLVAVAVDPQSAAADLEKAQAEAEAGRAKAQAVIDGSKAAIAAAQAKLRLSKKAAAIPEGGSSGGGGGGAGGAEEGDDDDEPLFNADEIEGMDKATVQRNLQAVGLPSSGKLDTIKARLAAVKKNSPFV